jgi:hypothetical protein
MLGDGTHRHERAAELAGGFQLKDVVERWAAS